MFICVFNPVVDMVNQLPERMYILEEDTKARGFFPIVICSAAPVYEV
jgi:sulfur transfer complex TusBCD TusB component (DsrH family)